MLMKVKGGPQTGFADAFREINLIVNPVGVQADRRVHVTASPRDGYINIAVDEERLSQNQLEDLFMWKLRWVGA